MYFVFLLFSTLTIYFTLVSSSSTNSGQLLKKLYNLSKKLEHVESQLTDSVDKLMTKIDENNQDLKDFIKSFHASRNNVDSNKKINALLIIDVQNDFINGTLALRNCPSKHNGEEVVPIINNLLDQVHFDVVVYSHDWHPSDHISFFDNINLRSNLLTSDSKPLAELEVYSKVAFSINGLDRMEQTLWPRHCVQDTIGAKLHPDLKVLTQNTNNQSIFHIYKGTKSDIDSYSAFWDNSKLSETKLNQELRSKNINQVFITGIATDWCVYSTALHAIEYGYKTFIIEDACRGVDESDIKERLNDFKRKTGHVIQSNEINEYLH